MKNTNLKRKIAILLFVSSIFSSIQTALGTDKVFEEERHLPKDTKFMKEDKGRFIVDEDAFNHIHKKVDFKSQEYNHSTSYLLGKQGGICSATLIDLMKNENEIIGTFVTAKHCLKEDPEIIFQGMTTSQGNPGYIACYEPYEKSFYGNDDKALIKAKLTKKNVKDEIFFLSPARMVENEITEDTLGVMNHYPLGNQTQRINEGLVIGANVSERKHEISTLPGSSGAGVFTKNRELFGVHSGGHPKAATDQKVLYNVSDLDGFTEEKRTNNIFLHNLLYTTSKKDLENFKDWYKMGMDNKGEKK